MSRSMVTRLPAAGRMGAALSVVLLAAAACGGAGRTTSSGAAGPAASPGASGPSTASAARGTVIMTGSGSAGTFLTDGTGRAVYLWVADATGTSTCSGTCAGAWPPVPATGTVTASGGALASDLSTITRPDGSRQVAYDGHALYYFAGDSGAGQTSGQDSDSFGAKWWLVGPSGTALTGSGTASSPPRSGY